MNFLDSITRWTGANGSKGFDQNAGLSTKGANLGSISDIPLELSRDQVARLALQNRAREAEQAETSKAVEDMIAKNRGYIQAENNLKNAPLRYSTSVDPRSGTSMSTPYREYNKDDLDTVANYKNSIDQGLAAKWLADRGAFK